MAAAKARVADTNASLGKRKADVANYAVNAYMLGDSGGSAAEMLDAEDGNEVGRRKGYASAAIGDREDLARPPCGWPRPRRRPTPPPSARPQEAAAEAKAAVDEKRKAAQAAVDEQQQIVDRVEGELSRLVAAEQRRRAAAAARQAPEATARRAAAQAAANPVVDEPAAPAVDAPSNPPSTPDPVADPPVGEGAEAAIAAARSVLGVRYTWGGADPSTGFDCSGLVMWAWAHGGKSLPHSSAAHVRLVAAHLDVVDPARRPHLLRQPGPPRRPVHRRRPDHPRPAHRLLRAGRRASTTGATSPEPDGSSWAAPAAGAVRSCSADSLAGCSERRRHRRCPTTDEHHRAPRRPIPADVEPGAGWLSLEQDPSSSRSPSCTGEDPAAADPNRPAASTSSSPPGRVDGDEVTVTADEFRSDSGDATAASQTVTVTSGEGEATVGLAGQAQLLRRPLARPQRAGRRTKPLFERKGDQLTVEAKFGPQGSREGDPGIAARRPRRPVPGRRRGLASRPVSSSTGSNRTRSPPRGRRRRCTGPAPAPRSS